MVLLVVAGGLVRWVAFGRWRGWFGKAEAVAAIGRQPVDEQAALRARRVGRAVGQAARHLPLECKCLPQAMVAAAMLRRRGIPATLVLGTLDSGRRGTPDDLHAWVLCGEQIIIGEGELGHSPVFAITSMVEH